jgi:N-acetylglucosamine kinase-like BadF-type ATPase
MGAAPGLLLGVDGGNTKAIALVARPDGTILAAERLLACSDIYAVPVDVALGVLEGVAEAALAAAGAHAEARVVAAFSLAGADWPEDFALLEDRLSRRWPAPLVVNDAIGALRATIPEGPGVVVACGTGTATGARGPDGSTWHSSFWQGPQGAHELGSMALRAVYRADLGIEPPTLLTERVLAATGERDVAAVLHAATARDGTARRDPAWLAPVLLDTAGAGDAVATGLLRRHGEELGQTALAAARRVGIDPAARFTLALTGGVLRHPGSGLRDAVVATVRAAAPAVVVAESSLEPAVGALLLAFDRAGIAVDRTVEARVRATLPPSELFDTRALPDGATPSG